MKHFSGRINGSLILLLQAFFLQLLWSPNHNILGDTPDSLALTACVFLVLMAAVGFIFLRITGWLLGMLTQGRSLLTVLIIRFGEPTLAVPAHLTMVYAICTVLYLNAYTVRRAFTHSPSRLINPGAEQ